MLINFKSSSTRTDRALARSINWTCLLLACRMLSTCPKHARRRSEKLMNRPLTASLAPAESPQKQCQSVQRTPECGEGYIQATRQAVDLKLVLTRAVMAPSSCSRAQRHLQASVTNTFASSVQLTLLKDSLQVANIFALNLEKILGVEATIFCPANI